MPRAPDQQAQEELLRAAVENDESALDHLTRTYGPVDSEQLANALQAATTYFDSETPHRIQQVLERKGNRERTTNEIIKEQEDNAAEDGTGHGYAKRSGGDY